MKQTKFNTGFTLVQILVVVAILALLAALTMPQAQAQTIGIGSIVIGTTNAPLYPMSTNISYFFVPAKTLVVTGINTNVSPSESMLVSYGFQIPGYTNIFIVNTISNNFAGWTNGTTWSTNIPQQSVAVPVIPYAQAVIGNNTNSFYLP